MDVRVLLFTTLVALGAGVLFGLVPALQASRAAALWLVARDTAVMVTLGVALALPAVFGLGRLIESQLFGVHAMDAATIAVGAAFVGIVALGAAALPARRAASVSPIEALRCE